MGDISDLADVGRLTRSPEGKRALEKFEKSVTGKKIVGVSFCELSTGVSVTLLLDGGDHLDITVIEQAFYARDLAGTLVQVGVPAPDMTIELPMIEFFGRGGALKPSWYGDCLPSRDFPMLIDLYLQGRLDLERFVSETIDLDQVEEAFHKMERGEVLRSVVVL